MYNSKINIISIKLVIFFFFFSDAKYWYDIALKQLGKNIKIAQKNQETGYRRKAKNIIVFVGDGMGLTTITAGRIYKGQYLKHGHGEEEMLAFDEFPFTGLAKVN